jgi:hypothetical protein
MADGTIQETMKEFCEACIVRDRVSGRYGIESRLEKIEKKQQELGIELARMAWLVPTVTALLVALINWLPRLIEAARAVTP